MIDRLRADVTAAIRGVLSAPVTTFATALLLAVAVGANLAVFGLIDRAILTPARHVVHPDAHRHQVGIHRQRVRQLLVEQVADAPAAHGEVGIGQTRVVRVDDLGKPVGESVQPDGVVAVP